MNAGKIRAGIVGAIASLFTLHAAEATIMHGPVASTEQGARNVQLAVLPPLSGTFNLNIQQAAVHIDPPSTPEPSSLALFGVGFAGLYGLTRRDRRPQP